MLVKKTTSANNLIPSLKEEFVKLIREENSQTASEILRQKLAKLDSLDDSFKVILTKKIITTLDKEIQLGISDQSSSASSSSSVAQTDNQNSGTIKVTILTALLAKNDIDINEMLSNYKLIEERGILADVEGGMNTLSYLLNYGHHQQVSRLLESYSPKQALKLITENTTTTKNHALINYYNKLISLEQDQKINEKTYWQGLIEKVKEAVSSYDINKLNEALTTIDSLPMGIKERILFEDNLEPSIPSCFHLALIDKESNLEIIEAFYQRGLSLGLSSLRKQTTAIDVLLNSKKPLETKVELLKKQPGFVNQCFIALDCKQRIKVLNLLALAKDDSFFQTCWEESQAFLSTANDVEQFNNYLNLILLRYSAQFNSRTLAIIHQHLTQTMKTPAQANTLLLRSILHGKNKENLDALNFLFETNLIDTIDIKNLILESVFANKSLEFYRILFDLDCFNSLLDKAYMPLMYERHYEAVELLTARGIQIPDSLWRLATFNLDHTDSKRYPKEYKALVPRLIQLTPDNAPLFTKFLRGRLVETDNEFEIKRLISRAVIQNHPSKISLLVKNRHYHQAFLTLNEQEKTTLINTLGGIHPSEVPFTPSIQQFLVESKLTAQIERYFRFHLLDNEWKHEHLIDDKLIEFLSGLVENYTACSHGLSPVQALNVLKLRSQDESYKAMINIKPRQPDQFHYLELMNLARNCGLDKSATAARLLHKIAPGIDFSTVLLINHLRSNEHSSIKEALLCFKELGWKIDLHSLMDNNLAVNECLTLAYLLTGSELPLNTIQNVAIAACGRTYLIEEWLKPLLTAGYNKQESLKVQIRGALQNLSTLGGAIGAEALRALMPEAEDVYYTNEQQKEREPYFADGYYPVGSLRGMCLNVIKRNKQLTEEAHEKLPLTLHEDNKSFFDSHCSFFRTDKGPVVLANSDYHLTLGAD